jgi:hypothetical protein
MAAPFTLRLATRPSVLIRRLDDELVLLNLDNERYYGLDGDSAHMWDVLSSSPTIDAGVAQLLAEYEVDPNQLRADVDAFLSELVENGLVELQGA